MSKSGRDYNRLLHLRKSSKYAKKNYFKNNLSSNDIYYRDIYLVNSDSTESYSRLLIDERWKESYYDPEYLEDDSPTFEIFKILEVELLLNKLKDSEDKNFLKVVIFFLIIHNIYEKLDNDFTESFEEIKKELIISINDFQNRKSGMTRKSKITTSYQRFLVEELGVSESCVKAYIRRYKKLIKVIFK